MAKKPETVVRQMGLRIKEIRVAAGWTQEMAAERLGQIASNYAKLEQGRMNPTVKTLAKIAQGLRVEVRDLFEAPTTKKARPGRPSKARR